jgi:hypothetical protein
METGMATAKTQACATQRLPVHLQRQKGYCFRIADSGFAEENKAGPRQRLTSKTII